MPVSVQDVISSHGWTNGPTTVRGMTLHPFHVKDALRGVVSDVGGNILHFEALAKTPVNVAKCFLDFTDGDGDFNLPEMVGMGDFGGVTPPMLPGVGRLTQLFNEDPADILKSVDGYRMLKEDARGNVWIHGAAHNRKWDIVDGGPDGGGHKIVTQFKVDRNNNRDIFKAFGEKPITVQREYLFTAADNGAEVEITTTIDGIGVFGHHSFFNTPNRAEWELSSPAKKILETDPKYHGVPTGKLIPNLAFNRSESIAGEFDGTLTELDFHAGSDGLAESMFIHSQDGRMITHSQNKAYAYKTIFTPINDMGALPFACSEAQLCSTDAFRLGSDDGNEFTPHGLRPSDVIVGREKIRIGLPVL